MAKTKQIATPETPAPPVALAIEWWPVDQPQPYEKNARKITDRAIEKVAASLKQFGWRQPIVVDSQGVIVAGHTRLLAAKRLRMDRVPVHMAIDLTPAQIRAYRLADNRTNEETSWDFMILGPELLEIKGMDLSLDLSVTGFEMKDIAQTVLGDFKQSKSQKKATDDGLKFRVIVDCDSEEHQTRLLDQFEHEGLTCRPLIS